MSQAKSVNIVPLTSEWWAEFETLMGPKGGYGGCWCMLWRQSKSDYDKNLGARNRLAMKELAAGGRAPGLLACQDSQPIGWISIAPRLEFPRLETSRVLKPVDDQDVWAVSCFLIAKSHRRRGIAVSMLMAACDFAGECGGKIVEGYPISPTKRPYPVAYAWTGFEQVFKRAGFKEVARRSPTRPIMRRKLVENNDGN